MSTAVSLPFHLLHDPLNIDYVDSQLTAVAISEPWLGSRPEIHPHQDRPPFFYRLEAVSIMVSAGGFIVKNHTISCPTLFSAAHIQDTLSFFVCPTTLPDIHHPAFPPLPTPLLGVIFGGAAGAISNLLSFILTHPISHVPYCQTTLLHIISPSSFPIQPSSCSCCY